MARREDSEKGKKKGLPERVTDQRREVAMRVVADMEEYGGEWTMPWIPFGAPHNPVTGTRYKGRNRFHLAGMSLLRGYDDPRWVTFKQAKEAGWTVPKGAKSAIVERWKGFRSSSDEEDGADEATAPGPFHFVCVGYWSVFNADELEGVPPMPDPSDRKDEPLDGLLDEVIASSRCPVHERRDYYGSYYDPAEDFVVVPPRCDFRSRGAFGGALLHEMAHSTGHPSALGRKLCGGWESPDYAFEELVAEMGSVFCCADLGIGSEADPGSKHYRNHLAYLASWKKGIRDDPDEVFRAAAAADRAADYIVGRMPGRGCPAGVRDDELA